MPGVIEYRTGRRRTLQAAGLLIVMTAACVYAVLAAGPFVRIVGAVGVVFFGGCGTFALIGVARRRGLMFAADDEGLRLPRGRFVPWAEVERVGLTQVRGRPAVGVRLTPDCPWAHRDGGFTRSATDGYDLTWLRITLARPLPDVAAELEAFRTGHGPAGPTLTD